MNQVAIVTGGSRGIGRSIAVTLAQTGMYTVINYKSNQREAEATLSLVRKVGGYGSLYPCDVSDYGAAKDLVDYAVNKTGRLDVLVNNAGISKHGLVMDMTEGDYDELMGINLKGPFNVTRHALPHLVKRGGAILNISSIWSDKGAANEVVYAMSKAGINAFTKSLAQEVAPMGVRVNAIAPGLIDTAMNNNLSQEEKDQMVCYLASHRLGTAEDVAHMARFLLSEEAAYINGQIITIDGGLMV